MHIRAILAFPVVLLACLPFVSARPIYNGASDSLACRDGSYLSTIIERYDDSLDAQRRDDYITLFTRAKVSAAQQAARKQGVKTGVATKQAANKAKKERVQAQKAAHPDAPPNKKGRPGKAPRPGKPSPPGWRANARTKGHILPKEPKTPKPNPAKGAKKSEKALKTQQAANTKTAARKAAGRTKFGDAAAAQKATTGLPARKGNFNVPGGGTFTGKDARIATFNSHLNSASPVGKDAAGKNKKPADRQPKTFNNNPHEVPKHGTAKPIDSMHGPGREYPITAGKPKGYHGELADLGAARVITQATGNSRTVKSGKGTKTVPETAFKGVIAHDPSRARGKGYNDHFQVPFTPPPPHP
jgi:hypothetical protein